ncbi:hypothetical protein ACN2XU_21480 [Primorskyibacter sp. 2E107]|uniref:hypothetical protein n=1 Tax=Primorskyibacter sp. 2E107 TaxID=3403458 RepID=UPI003AF90EF1
MIQVYLADARTAPLPSLTNHNSATRAAVWREPGEPTWDFQEITCISARINRFIRKQAVAKIGSISVLPAAALRWEAGDKLSRSDPAQHAAAYRRL